MLSNKQLLEIREHLERAQNPVFFYDNDADGLCSYVLFRKSIGRGKGIAVKSHPAVDKGYAKKAQELNADYVFVLDRPILGKEFVEEINKLQLPVVWIDHHDISGEKYENVLFFNPQGGTNKSNEPVSYWAYKIANRKEDKWVSLMGCIADHYLPDFSKEFAKEYSELWSKNIRKPFDAYYKTEIGRLARIIGFGLKDSVTHVIQMQNFLIKCKGPLDFFNEADSSKPFVKKYREVAKTYDSLMTKAKQSISGKLIFFSYGGNLSISAEISNELSYLYPNRVIVVAYSSGPFTNISLRGKKVRKLLNNMLSNFENASGGGHEEAVGARIQSRDLEKFREEIEKRLG